MCVQRSFAVPADRENVVSPAIHVDNLSKRYVRGERREGYRTLREALVEAFRSSWQRFFRRRPKCDGSNSFWALKDVSFDVRPGEVVGLIGRNGAGKSTLLKIVSRITEPTAGSVQLHGRVGSLLEVGTGFHPELSGRENIYLNGILLGMSRREIAQRFDEIVAFSEVDSFIDTPVKRYSSGMYVRLGFAVAASLNPEIMLVDEVLAVGDQSFQKKCLGKMSEVSQSGRTVVFVSHNMAAVENLCHRTIWIADGQVQRDGDTKEVIRAYLNSFGAVRAQVLDLTTATDRTGTGAVRFTKMELLAGDGAALSVFHSGDGMRVRLHYECQRDVPNLHFGVRVFTNNGVLLTDVHTWTTGQAVPIAPKGLGAIEAEIDFLNLMPGSYHLGIWASSFHEWHDVLDSVAKLDVEPSDFYGTGRGVEARFGTIFFPFRWSSPTISEGGDGRSGGRSTPGCDAIMAKSFPGSHCHANGQTETVH
jgi:lipopolysaccharide transport system ATP-binding protein